MPRTPNKTIYGHEDVLGFPRPENCLEIGALIGPLLPTDHPRDHVDDIAAQLGERAYIFFARHHFLIIILFSRSSTHNTVVAAPLLLLLLLPLLPQLLPPL